MYTEEIGKINKPHARWVAVDTRHIGDDNDYGMWLNKPTYALYKSGHKELALQLANTNPMRTAIITMADLDKEIISHDKFIEDQKATHAAYERAYSRD